MKRLIPALLLLMPRWLASVATALLLTVSIGILIVVQQQDLFVAGRLIDTAAIGNGEQIMLEISNPWEALLNLGAESEHRLVAADQFQVEETDPKKILWVLAMGEEIQNAGGFSILYADQLVMVPMPWQPKGFAKTLSEVKIYPLIAIIIGALLVIAGPLLTRLLSAVVLGGLLGIATWHGLHYAVFKGHIVLIDSLIQLSAWIAVVVGLIIGLRARRDRINMAVERIILILMVILAAPVIGPALQIPSHALMIIAGLLTLLSPIVGYALLGSYALSLGMKASLLASWTILGVSLLITLILRAAFTTDKDPIIRRIASHIDPNSGRLSLSALVNTRGK